MDADIAAQHALGKPLAPESAEGRARLAALLAGGGGAGAGMVDDVRALSGGASSASWLVCAGGRRFVFQRSAGAAGLSRRAQAAVMAKAGALGVPVPPVVAVTPPGDPLGDGMLTGFVEGEAIPQKWLRDAAFAPARTGLAQACGTALARLHGAPLSDWQGLGLAGGSGQALWHDAFATYRRLGVDVPAFDLAFAWAKPRMPAGGPTCLAHGDFRSGNLIVTPEGLAAVLDWELAHLSVPEEDLGWIAVNAWRFGAWDKPVGGFAGREALYAAYEAAGGTIDRDVVHLWEVFGTLKWGLSCLLLADDHCSGRVRSVERAAIGRRVSEVAADLVHLLAFGDI